jgi:hypothetical protein
MGVAQYFQDTHHSDSIFNPLGSSAIGRHRLLLTYLVATAAEQQLALLLQPLLLLLPLPASPLLLRNHNCNNRHCRNLQRPCIHKERPVWEMGGIRIHFWVVDSHT